MVMKMNKEEFLDQLSKQIDYSIEDCKKINEVLEDHMLIGKKNKDKIIEDLKNKLSIAEKEADNVYNAAVSLITTGIKDKLKHHFKSKD